MAEPMTWPHLLAPVAVATIANAFLFAGAWRGHQIERTTGKQPWWLGGGLAAYCAAAGLCMYALGDKPLTGGLELLPAMMMGQALGAILVYGLLHAFMFSRGQPRRERAVAMVFAVGLTGFMVAGLFATR